MTAVITSPVATKEISKATYVALEKRLQDLRLRVMREAAAISLSESPIVARRHVHEALRRFAESGLSWAGSSTRPIGDFPQDSYMYLEKRLHNVRRLVLQIAAKNADERAPGQVKVITPDDVGSAWSELSSNYSLLAALLLGDEN